MDPANRPFDVVGQLSSLRRYARSLVRNTSDADDLVQDALVKAYERQRSFKSGGNLRNWLLSILHNTHIDRYRSASARQRRDDIVSGDSSLSYPAPQEQSAYLSQVKNAFMRLPDHQREALHLVAIEDLSYQEAADMLGIISKAVLYHIREYSIANITAGCAMHGGTKAGKVANLASR